MTTYTCSRCTRAYGLRDGIDEKKMQCPTCGGQLYEAALTATEQAQRRGLWIGLFFSLSTLLFGVILYKHTSRPPEDGERQLVEARLHARSKYWRGVSPGRVHVEGDRCYDAIYLSDDRSYRFEAARALTGDVTRIAVFPLDHKPHHLRALFSVTYHGAVADKYRSYTGEDKHEKQLLELQASELCRVVRSVIN